LSKLHILQFKLPKNIGVAKKQRKRGKNSQYWLINIIAEVKIECSSIIYLSSNLIKQSRTWNTQSPWYICNSCAYKILLTPKALGIKFLVKYFWDEHIHHLLQVKFECTCILYFSNLLHPDGKANNLSNHWQERENTLCGVPIEGCAFQSSFLFVQWGVTLIRPHQRKFWKLWHFPQNINYTAIFILKHYEVFPFDPLIKLMRVQLWAKLTV
jgi:hypothetical protein